MENHFRKIIYITFLVYSISSIMQVTSLNAAVFNFGSNTGMINSLQISNPSQWSAYSEFGSNGAPQYYSVMLHKGESINVRLSVPLSGRYAYPHLAIIGPGFSSNLNISAQFQAPSQLHTLLFAMPQNPTLVYHPFIPSTTYTLTQTTFTASETATYYIVVFGGHANSPYELSSSQQSIPTIQSLITLSADSLEIYNWEGEPLLFVVLPLALALVIGNIIIYKEFKRKNVHLCSFNFWAAAFAGMFFFGGAATLLVQMMISLSSSHAYVPALSTIFLIVLSVILGTYAWMLAPNSHLPYEKKMEKRAMLLGIGIVAFVASSGFIVGPILALLAGIAPDNLLKGTNN